MMPFYKVRHLVGELEEHPCLQQLEDECAAMYFNVIRRQAPQTIHHGTGR
jgi:hypothetical protein